MRVLVLSRDGTQASIAGLMQDQGHDVMLRITDSICKDTWRGMVPIATSLKEAIAFEPQLVVAAERKVNDEAVAFQRLGIPTFGSHQQANPLEYDRWYGIQVAKANGVRVPETMQFKSPAEAVKMLKEASKRMVVKFNRGDSMASYMGRSNDDVMAFIKSAKDVSKDGILQEKIEGGETEFNVEGWFSHGRLIQPMYGSIEQKRFLSGDMGPNTGSESTIQWCYPGLYSRAIEDTWNRGTMFDWVRSVGYTGPLDMAFILDKDGKPYFLEFTPRFGINAAFGTLHALEGDVAQYLLKVANGTATEAPIRSNEYQIIINLSVPPYPYDIEDWQVEDQFAELPASQRFKPWYFYVMRKKDELVTTGIYGLIASVSATGSRKDLEKNIDDLKAYLKTAEITGKQFRSDSGSQIKGLKYLEKERFI